MREYMCSGVSYSGVGHKLSVNESLIMYILNKVSFFEQKHT